MMIATIERQRYWVIFICFAIIGIAHYLLQNIPSSGALYYGIAADLLITSPALYAFTTKKHSLKKPIILILFVIGLFTYTKYAPNEYADQVTSIVSLLGPLVELSIFSLVIFKFRGFIKRIDWKKEDIFMAVNQMTSQALDNKIVAKIVASEFCMFYYSLFAWKKSEPKSNEFTYHKTGSSALLYAIIGLILIETTAIHLLLMKWNVIVAYILLGLSIYTAIQVFAHIKAKSRRFIKLTDQSLILKNGLSNYFEIPFTQIKSIQKDTLCSVDKDILQVKFGLLEDLESHNLKLTFHAVLPYEKIYGIKAEAQSLLLHVDQEQEFIEAIRSRLTL